MAETIKASISVQIGDGSSSKSASAEVDTRSAEDGGENATKLGKTSGFQAGETIYILLHLPDGVKYDTADSGCFVHHNYEGNTFRSSEFKYEGRKTTYTVREELSFDGSSRTANLSKIAVKDSLSICGWRGENLARYYGSSNGQLTLTADRTAVQLPAIPTGWYPTSTNSNEAQRKAALNKFRKQTSMMSVVAVKYQVEALVFRYKIPSQTELDNVGKPPYPLIGTIYCVEEDANAC